MRTPRRFRPERAKEVVSAVKRELHAVPMMEVPSAEQSARAVQAARMLFRRTLSSWASDALVVRRAGLDRLTWRIAADRRGWSKAA